VYGTTFSVEADVRNTSGITISNIAVNFVAFEDLLVSREHYIVRGIAPYQTITLAAGETKHLTASGTLNPAANPSYVSAAVFAQLRNSPTKEVLQGCCCPWQDLPFEPSPGIFNPGWNLFSLPAIPDEPEVSAVFGHDMSNRIFGWDKAGKTFRIYPWDFTNLEMGAAYYLHLGDEVYKPSYKGTPSLYITYFGIPNPGWVLVGYPHAGEIAMAYCRIKNNATGVVRSASTDQRATDPWLNWNWIFLDSNEQQPKICSLTGGDDQYLRPWYGYLVWAYLGNLELRITGPR
jgi:hypothetical protein